MDNRDRPSTVQRRCCWSAKSGFLLFNGLVLLLFIPCPASIAQHHRPADLQTSNETGICTSMDIRNTLSSFEKLNGCRVVEGFVQILLFDNFNETSFDNLTFPELTEITDYLLLYRVNGLRTLAHLFPNLAVIRGQSLFFTYALVIFEMPSLQEIALYSLTDITRGLVRIDRNPSLCFVNSIDWDLITHEKGQNFIKALRPENECPLCFDDDSNAIGDEERHHRCPNSTRPSESFKRGNKYLCWNRHHCQKVCKPECKACDANGQCCDSECLGGCIGRPDNCIVCRHLTTGSGNDRKCSTECQDDHFEYLGRRCVKRDECINMKSPIQTLLGGPREEQSYKTFNRSCILVCPNNYMPDDTNNTCVQCTGRCAKECPGTNVDNLLSAQQLRGCTKIVGSLEIQIRGERSIVNELEENLSMIEHIEGYLKIVRSFPLVSLNFLKSLRVIGGNPLESERYAFYVVDNQNLVEIWDWTNRTLEMKRGRLLFHLNSKLCRSKIEELAQKVNLKPSFTDFEVSTSNGEKVACDVRKMEVNVATVHSRSVILNWMGFNIDDQRKLLGYVVYSIEAPYQNVTMYDGRDACGGDGWRVDDVSAHEVVTYFLPHLKPYTQYAFYVKTTTIAAYPIGGQSDIKYFRTLPDVPSLPRNLQIKSNASDTLIISWDPPLEPNGKLTHYIVEGVEKPFAFMEEKNYCTDPPVTPPTVSVEVAEKKPENETCKCEQDSKKLNTKVKEEGERRDEINFENALHNVVYIRKEPNKRKKRDFMGPNFPYNFSSKAPPYTDTVRNVTRSGKETWISFSFNVTGRTHLYIDRLQHFTSYDIMVRACREVESINDTNSPCSEQKSANGTTKKKDGADDIKRIEVVANKSLDSYTVIWEEPTEPNGAILNYQIEYRRLSIERTKPYEFCITRKETQITNHTLSYTFRKLTPGNYSLKLRAKSHADWGSYSPEVYFYIEPASADSTLHIILFVILVVMASGIAVFLYIRRRRKNAGTGMKLIASVNPEYVSTVYEPDEWEVPRKKIELLQELGQGSFGMVYEGLARDIRGQSEIRCAVKTVNDYATNRERIEFLNEASVMKAFDTAHVVRLLGVVSQGQPTLVVMELMANGDLKSYLRSHRPDAETDDVPRQPPTLKRILQMAIEIADGMAYLAAKKFVHRDLAARNCMVAEDLTVKIGDFGMARDIYETDYYRKGSKGLLPVRWMAPESLKDGVFTSSSDVWSYGVVLWEMATLASQPYQGLSNDEVLRYVIDCGVMQKPDNCPDKLYSLMTKCWQYKPASRPTFLQLCAELLDDASKDFAQISFYHSAAGVEARNVRPTPPLSQDDPTTPLRATGESESIANSSDDESEPEFNLINNTSRIEFPSYPPTSRDSSTTANGYVGRHPPNATAASHC